MGFTGREKPLSERVEEELDEIASLVKKTKKVKTIPEHWETLSDAEFHFGQLLIQHVDKLRENGDLKVIINADGFLTPIVRTKSIQDLLGTKPHFISDKEFVKYYYGGINHDLLKKLHPLKIRFRSWISRDVICHDKNVISPIIKQYVQDNGVRSKTNNNKKRLRPNEAPEGRIARKREKLKRLAGAKHCRKLILRLFGLKAYRTIITKAKENEIDRMIAMAEKIEIVKDLPDGWVTLTTAETRLGETLVPHIPKLKRNKAFKLIRNFDGVVTPIAHLEHASSVLHLRPHFTDSYELKFVHNFSYGRRDIMVYLRDGKVPERRFNRWDSKKIVVFDADLAIPFLQSLSTMDARPGKRRTILNYKRGDKRMIGGWKAECNDGLNFDWKHYRLNFQWRKNAQDAV